MLEDKIELICSEAGATEEPTFYFSDNQWLADKEGREFIPNFRYEVATIKPYKGTRKNPKPFHFYNILSHIMFNYDYVISEGGVEADDEMAMAQVENAKKYGAAINTHAGPVLLDYEDWLKYGHITFVVDSKGYVVNDTGRGETRKIWALHRDILGNPEGKVVDHINGNKLDNRKYNLRVCSIKENIRNSKPKEGTSKYKGVHWDKSRNKWVSSIKVDREGKYLGRFNKEIDAAKAYDVAAEKYFGEFARLNLSTPYVKPFKETVICSRDKDLRIAPLRHYSWECGKQHSIGPTTTHRIGWLVKEAVKKIRDDKEVTEYKYYGYGLSFFFFQMLTGDSADNIGGLPSWGNVAAYNLLHELKTEEEMLEAVKNAYKEKLGPKSKEYFMENMKLLWMQQERGVYYV